MPNAFSEFVEYIGDKEVCVTVTLLHTFKTMLEKYGVYPPTMAAVFDIIKFLEERKILELSTQKDGSTLIKLRNYEQ